MCSTIFYKQNNKNQKPKKIAFLGYKNNKFK